MEKEKDCLNLKMNSNRCKLNYAFLSAFLTVPAALLIFSLAGRLPGGENSFLYGDLREQYIAFLPLFWRSLFGGEGIGYTFYVSLGMPSIPIYTGSSMSPFNLLYLLIDHAELASIIIVVFKLALAAYTFQRFSANVLKNDSLSSVIFSVGYALNGYCVIFYFNLHLLDGVYMLPVIFMLIAESVKKRCYAKLIFAYAYLFVVEFYGGYIIGFFSLLFFILLMISGYKKEWRNYIRASIGFGISVVCAALIGAVFLYPTAVFLLGSYSAGIDVPWDLSVKIWDIYKNMYIGQYQGTQSPYPYIYCGVMILYLVPCFFFDRRVKKKYKWLAFAVLGYLLLCSLWTPGYMFMHGFEYPDGYGFRFAYLYSFVLMAIGCAEWRYMDSKSPWQIGILFIVQTAVYFILNIKEENFTAYDGIINIVFLLVLPVLFILMHKYGSKKLFQGIFLGIVCVELVVNGVLATKKIEVPRLEKREVYQVFTSINRRALDEIKSYDSGFYRIAQENIYNANDSAINDYYGLAYFSSMENTRMRDTLGILGYSTSARVVGDMGGTSLTRMLLAQKYSIVANDVDYIQGRSEALWLQNDYFLSLGYMVSDEILGMSLDRDNAFENQNMVASRMTGEDIAVFTPYPGDVTVSSNNMQLGEAYLLNGNRVMGMKPLEGMTEGSLTFSLDDTGMPVYAYFAQGESIWTQNVVYFESGERDRIRMGMPAILSIPQIIRLDKDEEGRYYVGIYYDETHTNYNYYKEAYFYCYDENAVNWVYEQLKDNQMNILEIKGSDITAEIEVPVDKHILFTSIPYDDGWHVMVDGKEADTLAVVNDTFLAVELTEGHHELKFYYSSDTDRVGVILSIVGIVMCLIMIIMEKNSRKDISKTDRG